MKLSEIGIISGVILAVQAVVMALGLNSVAVQAGSCLPDRDPTATAIPEPEREKPDRTPVDAVVELSAPGQAGAWSEVQWQDSAGNWQTVEGWRGPLDDAGRISWWGARKDFGTGPFRWVVKSGPTGPILGVSKPFLLPSNPDETERVIIPVGS